MELCNCINTGLSEIQKAEESERWAKRLVEAQLQTISWTSLYLIPLNSLLSGVPPSYGLMLSLVILFVMSLSCRLGCILPHFGCIVHVFVPSLPHTPDRAQRPHEGPYSHLSLSLPFSRPLSFYFTLSLVPNHQHGRKYFLTHWWEKPKSVQKFPPKSMWPFPLPTLTSFVNPPLTPRKSTPPIPSNTSIL